MNWNSKCMMIIGAVVLVAVIPVRPQNPELQQKLGAVKQSMAENQQKLRQYQWIETTQLTLKGDAKPPTKNSCLYGPDGQVQKTPIGPPQEEPKRRQNEAKNHREEKRGNERLHARREGCPQHVRATQSRRKCRQPTRQARLALNPVPGAVNLVFTDYAQSGDKMTLTFDTAAKKITALNINTYMGQEKDAVTLQVRMGSLPDGTNYVQQTILNGTAKQLVVTTTNSDYQKLGG